MWRPYNVQRSIGEEENPQTINFECKNSRRNVVDSWQKHMQKWIKTYRRRSVLRERRRPQSHHLLTVRVKGEKPLKNRYAKEEIKVFRWDAAHQFFISPPMKTQKGKISKSIKQSKNTKKIEPKETTAKIVSNAPLPIIQITKVKNYLHLSGREANLQPGEKWIPFI